MTVVDGGTSSGVAGVVCAAAGATVVEATIKMRAIGRRMLGFIAKSVACPACDNIAEKVAPPHAGDRYRCSLPGLAEFTGRRWQDHKAERKGFEPPVPFGTHDFQSCTFDHSVTSPGGVRLP